MKTLILLFLTPLCAGRLKAQTSKDQLMLGGAITFSRETSGDNDYEDNSIIFSPSFGYFVIDNVAVGANVALSQVNDRNLSATVVRSSIGFGPFVRYYKFTSNENFAFFGHAQLMVQSRKSESASYI